MALSCSTTSRSGRRRTWPAEDGEGARAFGRGKIALWLTYASDERAVREVADECGAAGVEAHVSKLDLADPEEPARFAAAVGETWGDLHVLVNNAGVCPFTPVEQIDVEEWDHVLNVNLRGPFLLTRALLPLLRAAAGDRAVVNISSLAGQTGGIHAGAHYAASKAGLLSLTRTFAALLAREGIRVNSVTPGPVDTAMTNVLGNEAVESVRSAVPLGRVATPDEIAATVAFLASPDAAYTTGTICEVNGGLHIA
jgi:3-oxoacyl-[acyl-carrier protein] reductase